MVCIFPSCVRISRLPIYLNTTLAIGQIVVTSNEKKNAKVREGANGWVRVHVRAQFFHVDTQIENVQKFKKWKFTKVETGRVSDAKKSKKMARLHLFWYN